MPLLTDVQETALRAEVAADLQTVAAAWNVFDRRRAFSSKKDFIDRTSKLIGSDPTAAKKECRFLEIELVNVTDSPDEGSAECPVAVIKYNIHAFHEFVDARPDGSHSDGDFTSLILALRTHFLTKSDYAADYAETDGLEFDEFTQFGADGFTDIVGHFKDFTLTIHFYDGPDH